MILNHRRKIPQPVVFIGLAVALSLFGDMALYTILPIFYLDLHLSPFQVGLILSLNRWVRLITNRFAGRMLSRYSQKILFTVSLLLGSALAAFYAFAPPIVFFLTARVLWGLCWSFLRHVGVMNAIESGAKQSAGKRVGVFQGLVQIGFIAGTFSSGFLFDLLGFKWTLLLMSAFSLLSIPFDLAGFRRSPSRTIPFISGSHRTFFSHLALSVKAWVVACVGSGLIMSTLGYVLKERLGDAVSLGSLVIGITTLNGILLAFRYVIQSAGAPLSGVMLDRVGQKRIERLAFVLSTIILAVAAFFSRSVLLVPLVVLFFITSTVARIALITRASLLGSRSYAGFATASDFGAAIGPLLGWIGISAVADPLFVFIFGGALFAIATLLPMSKETTTHTLTI